MSKILSESESRKVFKENEVVLITGSFDFLHLGHLRFFDAVKKSIPDGCRIFVVLLSDENIKERKGDKRPIFNQGERCEALSFVEIIDYIYPWQKPWQELRNFVIENKPKYLAVVEGDPGYENKKEIIESIGGKLINVKKIDNYSSSRIIKQLGL